MAARQTPAKPTPKPRRGNPSRQRSRTPWLRAIDLVGLEALQRNSTKVQLRSWKEGGPSQGGVPADVLLPLLLEKLEAARNREFAVLFQEEAHRLNAAVGACQQVLNETAAAVELLKAHQAEVFRRLTSMTGMRPLKGMGEIA